MRGYSVRWASQFLAAAAAFVVWGAFAAAAETLTLDGIVTDASGKPVASALVRVTGPRSARSQTDARGRFHLRLGEPGTYVLTLTEPGFLPYRRNLSVRAASTRPIRIALVPTTPPVIGSVTGYARAPFNATSVAQKLFPREAYRDQGQPSTATVLDQTPGALIARPTDANDAAPLAPQYAQVRGGLPYESPTLLDGAPISLPSSGTFDLSLIPTFVLGEVELIQGPGDPAGAGGGVGGALNLLTAEPTVPVRGTLELEGDSRGGQFSDLAYDGTLPGGKFAFATMAAVDGDAGPLNRMDLPVLTSTGGTSCCTGVPSDALRKALLLTLRMTPSRALTVTTTFLGVNLDRALAGEEGTLLDGAYAGLVPSLDTYEDARLRFLQALARIDRGSELFDVRLYGLNLDRDLESGLAGVTANALDTESGAGIAWHHQADRNVYGASLDATTGTAGDDDPYAPPVLPGSGQQSARMRATAVLHPSARDEIDLAAGTQSLSEQAAPTGARLAAWHWSPSNARLGYAHTLLRGLALRAAVGTSAVAPPLEALSGGPALLQSYVGFPDRYVAYTSSVSDIERADGADVGVEWRLHGDSTTLSADWYDNGTHGAYVLESESGAGDSQLERWFNGPPMIERGAQFTLSQFKRVGMGFIAQMAFPRSYVVGPLPPGFYANGNLAILPGQNFAGGAFFVPGENGVAPIRVPYAQGYAEISYKYPRGSRLSLGMLYEGSNNAYTQPAFATFNANLELSLGPKAKLQISVENLFDALDTRLPLAFAGIPVPLAIGTLGATNANALVPRTIRFMVRQSFGAGSIVER